MEEVPQNQSMFSPLLQVTSLSKYLAMVLFILMPFVGGWIGYTYAPVKIVEVERVIIKTQETRVNDETSEFIFVGKKIGEMQLAEMSPYNANFSEISPENAKMLFKGPIEVAGTFEHVQFEAGFEGYCASEFTDETMSKLPYIPAYLPLSREYGAPADFFCFENAEFIISELGTEPVKATVLIDNYQLNSYPSEVIDKAEFVEVLSIEN